MRPWLGSLRGRLTLALVVGIGALSTGAGWWIETSLRERIAGDFDTALLAKANDLATLVEQENGIVEFDYEARFQPEFEREVLPGYFQIWLGDGQELMRSRWLDGDLARPVTGAHPEFADATLPGGRAVRCVVLRFTPKSPGDEDAAEAAAPTAAVPPHELVLAVARGREPLAATLGGMRGAIVVSTLLAALLGAVAVVWLVGRTLRPVRTVAAQVAALQADDPTRRITVPHAPVELAPVVQQVNAMLGRLHEARERERRFAGNVAHELRTPVSELRALASVGARWPEDVEAVRGFFADVGDVAQRMDQMIRDLLLLSRLRGGAEQVCTTTVRLRELVLEVVARQTRVTGAPRVLVHVPLDATVSTDRGKLAIVLDNLIGNACAYGLPGAAVECRAGVTRGSFWVEVENRADRLAEADLARLCEPFWRGDASRAASEHAGLGLALVAAIARLLQLEVTLTQDAHGVFVARLGHRPGAAPTPPVVDAPLPVDPSPLPA